MRKKRTLKFGTILMLLGAILILAAITLVVCNFLEEKKAERSAEIVLNELIRYVDENKQTHANEQSGTGSVDTPPDYVINPDMKMPTKTIDGEEYIGYLNLQTLDIKLPVMAEWNYKNLKTAPCCYVGSAYKTGFVICAHNYRLHFGLIKTMKTGDEFTFTDIDGNEFVYRTVGVEVLKPHEVSEMKDDTWDITLFTCTIGGATRVTLRAERVN